MKNKRTYLVVTQRYWEGASINIESKYHSKKEAIKEALKIKNMDLSLESGRKSWVMSKSAFIRKYPNIAKEEL